LAQERLLKFLCQGKPLACSGLRKHFQRLLLSQVLS